MNWLRALGLTVFWFAASAVTLARPDVASSGVADGTFVGIEQGDYAHFLIKDKHGNDQSFIILRPDRSVQPFIDEANRLKGRKVRIHWKEEKIPEAGNEPVKTVVSVEKQR